MIENYHNDSIFSQSLETEKGKLIKQEKYSNIIKIYNDK